MRRIIYKLAFIVFTGAIAVFPSLRFSREELDVRENRTLARWPSISEILPRGWSGFWHGFEDAFNDRFYGRRAMMRLHGELVSLLGESGNDMVLEGTEGWLYYRKTLDAFDNSSHFDRETKRAIVDKISGVAEMCRRHGKPFAVLVVPDKCRVYPENVTHYLKIREDAKGRTEDLVAALRALGSFPVVYPRQRLRDERERRVGLLYFRQDTHWSPEGAWVGGFVGVSNAFGSLVGNSFRRLEEPEWRGACGESPSCDLAAMLPYDVAPDDASSYRYPVFCDEDAFELTGGREFKVSESTLGQGTLFVFRDSFALAMMPFLGRAFKRVYYRRGTELWPEDQDAFESSDVVLLEICERNLTRLAMAKAGGK